MPIYEFKCKECGHKFDQMVSSADKDKVTCPQCGAINPRQLFSVFATSKSSGSSDPCLGCGSAGTGG